MHARECYGPYTAAVDVPTLVPTLVQGTVPVYLFYSIRHFFQGLPTDDHSFQSQLEGEPGAKFEAVSGCKMHGTIELAALLKMTQKLVLGSCRSRSLLQQFAARYFHLSKYPAKFTMDVVVDGGFVVEATADAGGTVTRTVDCDDADSRQRGASFPIAGVTARCF